jgi:hypothetical protein
VSVRATTVGAALAMLGCLTAGCASGSTGNITDPSSRPSIPTTTPSSATVKPTSPATTAATFPLTGVGTNNTGAVSARVIAAALSASYGQTQPVGAAQADTVYVEYSDTIRMIALYQSQSAPAIGPVAQTRPVDGNILAFQQPGFANTGGPPGFVQQLDAATVADLSNTKDPGAYTTTAAGVTTSTDALRRSTAATPPATPLLTFGSATGPLDKAATAAHTVTVPAVAGFPSVSWTYDAKSGRWHTSDPVLSAASPTNLIFQQVSYKGVELHHPGGPVVPSAHVYGAGAATVVSGPSGVKGVWSKPGPAAVTVYADSSGVPLSFRPGVTWVFLIPSGTTVTYS